MFFGDLADNVRRWSVPLLIFALHATASLRLALDRNALCRTFHAAYAAENMLFRDRRLDLRRHCIRDHAG